MRFKCDCFSKISWNILIIFGFYVFGYVIEMCFNFFDCIVVVLVNCVLDGLF